MNCNKFEIQVCDYLDGELKEKDKIRFENHLESCHLCKLYFQKMQNTVNMLQTVRQIDLPPSFHDRLKKSLMECTTEKKETNIIQLTKDEKVKRPVAKKVFQTVATFAACVLIVVGVVTGGQHFLRTKSENSAEQNLFAMDMDSSSMKMVEGLRGGEQPAATTQETVATTQTLNETTTKGMLMQMAGSYRSYQQAEYKINLITDDKQETMGKVQTIAETYQAKFDTQEDKKLVEDSFVLKLYLPVNQYDSFSQALLTLKKEGLISGYIESELTVIDYGFEVEQIKNSIKDYTDQIASIKEKQFEKHWQKR